MSVRLLHVSDLETAFDDPERVGRVAGTIRALDGPDALVAGSGDTTGPGVLALVEEGRQSLEFFERVGLAVDVPGNHDLDHGVDAASRLFRESPQSWLAANVEVDGTGLDGIASHRLLDVDGVTVGVTGVTTPTLPEITPPASHLDVTDPVAAAEEAVATLRERGADLVVVLAHLRDDERLASELDVDAVLSGHVHEERATVVNGVPVTRPGSGGDVVYEIRLDGASDDPDGSAAATGGSGDDVPATVGDGDPDRDGPIRRHAVADAPVHERVERALAERADAAGLTAPVGTIDPPIERTRAARKGGESRLGNLVADAYRWRADVDVGLQNGAGLRTGPSLSGTVTRGELVGLVPFDAALVVAHVTGAELRAICREASPAHGAHVQPGDWNAHWSGIEATWDRSTAEFSSFHVGGSPVDSEATYELATSEYLLETDFEFPTLETRHRTRTLDPQYEAVVDYVRETSPAPRIEGRLAFD